MPSQNQRTRGEHPSNLEFEKEKCNVYSDGHITFGVRCIHLAFAPLFLFKIFPTCIYTNLTYYEHIITDINRTELHISIP